MRQRKFHVLMYAFNYFYFFEVLQFATFPAKVARKLTSKKQKQVCARRERIARKGVHRMTKEEIRIVQKEILQRLLILIEHENDVRVIKNIIKILINNR